jgi:hypothetical protein
VHLIRVSDIFQVRSYREQAAVTDCFGTKVHRNVREESDMRKALLVITLFMAVASGSNADAGMISTHAFTRVNGRGSGNLETNSEVYFFTSCFAEASPGAPLDTGLHSGFGTGNGYTYVESRAGVEAYAGDLLHASAYAYSNSAGDFVPAATASASAGWRDVVILEALGANLPPSIRLNFEVHGVFSGALPWGYRGVNGVSSFLEILAFDRVPTNADFNLAYPNYDGFANFKAGIGVSDQTYSFARAGFWDSATFVPYAFLPNGFEFKGTYHIDAQYDPAVGGYGWGIVLTAFAQASLAYGTTDLGQTLKLTSITDIQGNSLPGTIHFDSSLRMGDRPIASPVPEPSSLVLLSLGLTMVSGRAWRSFRRA